jgi:hypothetical protein
MAEIKNSFLKSKMNKDLDDRLIPNGEYRDANNISVGKSEDDDIGALENVKGNTLVPGTNVGSLEVIGYLKDNNSETIYLFLTNNSTASPGTSHYIYKYFNNSYTKIVEGAFLNFSADNYITGVNLVENLLFFTDNRNQPRKINVTATPPVVNPTTGSTITPGYYTRENQISVAKYNPYEPLELLTTIKTTGATSSGVTLTLAAANTLIKKGMNVIVKNSSNVQKVDANKYIYVTNVVGTTVTLNAQPTDESNNNYNILSTDTITFLVTTMTGKDITYDFNGGNDWPGDPDFLQDLFVRFSYRFKFDDEEYSIMAPFSQPTFIPQQKGYFLAGDEDAAYRSTILAFMQNGVQNVELIIPLPDAQNNLGNQTDNTYKIIELDILYKESDARSVKVLDTINVDNLNSTSNIYKYNYQSRKPYKTLPERQTVRVYDRVPVRALAQEVSGNRVMYGNFQSQHTPPATLDYNVGANAKNTTVFTNWAEYPNHTLKQNRNYQVGFILSDKFGRQSSVILSSVDSTGQTVSGTFFGGSTFYHPYRASGQNLDQWFGDALKVVINETIKSSVNRDGEGAPGLYAEKISNGFNITGTPIIATNSTTSADNTAGGTTTALVLVTANTDIIQGMTVTGAGLPEGVTIATVTNSQNFVLSSAQNIPINSNLTYIKHTYTFTLAGGAATTGLPTVNSYLRGEYIDFVKVTNVTGTAPYVVTTEERVNDLLYSKNPLNDPDTKFSYTLPNTLGWYSYKVVVKQQEQDYYNCYLPGFLNGYPSTTSVTNPPVFPTTENNKTAHTVLLNDNINKIPRDLSETSDQQKQFRSSVRLYGRVNNTAADNIQYFPVSTGTQTLPLAMTADTISTAFDLSMYSDDISTTNVPFYQLETNPFIARLATSNAGTTAVGLPSSSMTIQLSIAETEPVESLLQLFYETSTTGLIADLNADIDTGYDGVVGLSALSYSQNENMASNQDVTAVFYPQNNQGSNFSNAQIQNVQMSVIDGALTNRGSGNINLDPSLSNGFTGDFKLVTSGTGYKIQTAVNTFVYSNAGYNVDKSSKESYSFNFTWTTTTGVGGDTSSTPFTQNLTNLAPEFTVGASLPDVTVSASATSVVTRDGNNGSASNSTIGLRYSIVPSSNPNSYFSCDAASGAITKSLSTPIGVYNITLKIEDAILNGVAQNNTLSITKNQKITVGANAVNNGVISNCYWTRTPNLAGTAQITAPFNGTTVVGVWYLSNNVLASNAFPVTPSTNTSQSNFLHRLGSAALSSGTLVVSCNMQQRFSNNQGGSMSFVNSSIIWKVWHRNPSVTSNWAMIEDVNNDNMGAPGVTSFISNPSFGTTKHAQTVFAFDEPGEYAIAATNANTGQAAVAADAMCAWVNTNDLYYSTCVVENGLEVTSTSNPKYYEYDISGAQTAYNCATGGTQRYAPMPYAQYVDLFYTTNALNVPWTHSQAEYRSFKTDAAKPLTSIRVSAKFGTNGIKISPALIPDACSDQYARACQAGNITCAHPIYGGEGW